jgi:hypothetical protein
VGRNTGYHLLVPGFGRGDVEDPLPGLAGQLFGVTAFAAASAAQN